MFKAIRKTVALLVLTLLATMATAQTVNMSKYITLTVTQGEQIRKVLPTPMELLSLPADRASPPRKASSGATDNATHPRKFSIKQIKTFQRFNNINTQ